uniref:Uncharacterized protein n=1 Tax=viral metagenome TaxID=1070528 RepID=A0A6C0BNP3_9ZZZZ
MDAKLLELDGNLSVRFYPEYSAVNATDLLTVAGLSAVESRNLTHNTFMTPYTFPVAADEYGILWKCLKLFLRELINMQCLKAVEANYLFSKLRACPQITQVS